MEEWLGNDTGRELLLCPGFGVEEAAVMERAGCVRTRRFGVLADEDAYLVYGVGPSASS